MSARQGVILATVAVAAALVTLVLLPPAVRLSYLAAGLVYALLQGLRDRSLLRRAVKGIATRWRFVRPLLFMPVLFWVLCWPVGIVWDLYDWGMSAPDYDDEDNE